MRFIAVDENAADELVSDRFLQSSEFDAGRLLVRRIQGKEREVTLNPRISIVEQESGLYFLSSNSASPNSPNLIVLDLVQAPIFSGRSDAECLLIFQKVIRFAVRYWKKLRPSRSEMILSGSSKVILFPFPISNQTSFRIAIDREPDKKRMEKRGAGNFLLVYKCGTSEGDGPNEEPATTEFRRALKGLPEARKNVRVPELNQQTGAEITALHVTSLESSLPSQLPTQQGYSRWLHFLTEKQKGFVTDGVRIPHRIEGPAGTGKTLCLVLKCIHELIEAQKAQSDHRSIFVTHSEATRRAIQELFNTNDPDEFSQRDRYTSPQSVQVTTLHRLCGDLLNTEISETEFLDRDAMESKSVQLLYVTEAVHETIEKELKTYRQFMSQDFLSFLEREDEWAISEMAQHEISVVVKGRAEDDLEKYRKLPFLANGLPVRSQDDRGFVFLIFQNYQEKLRAAAQFDTDDIVLSAIGQLNTPIWRRRRSREGYDSIFIDETHLFNMNELSVFHHLTRGEASCPISYSVDRSQSLGDRGWNDCSFDDIFERSDGRNGGIAVRSVFRCSPDIVNLAFSITSSGATLFTNFDDPLKLASSVFTEAEERKSSPPIYYSFTNDAEMVAGAFRRAEQIVGELQGTRSDVLIVAFDQTVFDSLMKVAASANKPVEIIKERGDVDVVRRAEKSGRFVLGMVDYVGGLEFGASVLVGVDHGRVPPTRDHSTSESASFLSYAFHSKLYVAITRAKFRVEILGTKDRGPSKLLGMAFRSNVLSEHSNG